MPFLHKRQTVWICPLFCLSQIKQFWLLRQFLTLSLGTTIVLKLCGAACLSLNSLLEHWLVLSCCTFWKRLSKNSWGQTNPQREADQVRSGWSREAIYTWCCAGRLCWHTVLSWECVSATHFWLVAAICDLQFDQKHQTKSIITTFKWCFFFYTSLWPQCYINALTGKWWLVISKTDRSHLICLWLRHFICLWLSQINIY